MTRPAYETVRQVAPFASVLLQDNPGPMTLDGTNTWLLGSSDGLVVVDPGQYDGEDGTTHLDRVLAAAPSIALVLVTHRHVDHGQICAALHERTGAPVRGLDPAQCLGAEPLRDGEVLRAAGLKLDVLATPGHTSDSTSFVVDDGAAVLTGDTILGRGTTVVAHPDGNLGDYLASLQRLQGLGQVLTLPGHGGELPSVADVAGMYLAHRAQRLDQIRAALDTLGADATARQVVEVVYADVDQGLWWAAEMSVEAQLEYLRS